MKFSDKGGSITVRVDITDHQLAVHLDQENEASNESLLIISPKQSNDPDEV